MELVENRVAMRGQAIAEILSRYAAAKNCHDVGEILALCHDDCFYESIAQGVRVEGKTALEFFYDALFEALPDYYCAFEGTAYGGDVAVVWGHWGGTISRGFFGLSAKVGRQIKIPTAFVCTFRDALVASDVGYFDLATLADQAGVPLEALRSAPVFEDTPA
jgi:steroid delta-isomerase-like uncharacterized protein